MTLAHIRPPLRRAGLLIASAALAVLLSAAPAFAAASTSSLGSSDPVTTAVKASQSVYATGAPTVVIAGVWGDQLSGAGLAGAVSGPLLIAPRDAVPTSVRDELARLAPQRAFLVGAYTDAAVAQVEAVLPAAEVVRISGASAAATSELVAERIAAERLTPPERILVASTSRPDLALPLAGPAAARGWPVVLVDAADLRRPGRVAAAVEASSALIVTDGSSVTQSTARSVAKALGPALVTTRTYADGYLAAAGIAEWSLSAAGLGFERPVVATRAVSGNVITAATLAARSDSVAITVPTASLPSWLAAKLYSRGQAVRTIVFLGEVASLQRAEVRQALRAPLFSAGEAMRHVKALTGIGVRRAGSSAERRAASYIATKLRSYGYKVTVQTVPIYGGGTTRNVIAEKTGTTSDVIVLGAHMDSKWPSPGGNDNASGVGVTLELARVLAESDVAPTVRFIAFGAEEIGGPSADNHHYGSRGYVARLSSSQRRRIEAMLSIDMVGYGSTFTVRNLRRAPMTAADSMRAWARFSGQRLVYLKDPSRTGWSDHEAFEFKGIPVAWLEWRSDPAYHTRRDTYGHVQSSRVGATGRLVRGWLLDLTPAEVEALR